jgi:cell division protein FtsB
MRFLALTLVILIAALQYPLWVGKGGWMRVWEIDRQLHDQRAANDKLRQRNGALEAEVRDLKNGYDAIEERARNELGMTKPDEVFYEVLQGAATAKPNR